MAQQSQNSLDDLILPPAVSRTGQFMEGAGAFWIGFRVLSRHRRLLAHAILPLLINLVITLAIVGALALMTIVVAPKMHAWFSNQLPTAWTSVAWLADIVFVILAAVFLLGAALLLWRLLTGILCGYYYGKLAREVELILGLEASEIQDISVWDETVDTVLDLVWLVSVFVLSLLLTLIPFVGAIVGAGFNLYWQCFVAGLDHQAFPLMLRGRRRKDRYEFAKQHRWHTLGLGATLLALQFIPVVGAVVGMTAVPGAVILHRRLTLNAKANPQDDR